MSSRFPFFEYVWGTAATGIFLGGAGLLTASLCNSAIVGYLVPLCYYGANLLTDPDKLGVFYLFSLQTGNVAGRVWLTVGGVYFLATTLCVVALRKKLR